MYRTRFAPSPTGPMHLGHARTGLVAFLRAKQRGGEIVMRIEDLDEGRSRDRYVDAILKDHEWLGLTWDVGPVTQADRRDAYEAAIDQLSASGGVFPCTCSRRELREASAPHEEDRQPPYPGTCFDGPSHPDKTPALRYRADTLPAFEDAVAGHQRSPGGDAFVIKRSDGLFAYQLAVVVDDIEHGITEVVRGDDLLHATHLQLALYAGLQKKAPDWLHVPLVNDASGTRLASRRKSATISDYRDAGWSAGAVRAMLAESLGVAPEDSDESPSTRSMSMETLIERFDLAAMPKHPVVLANAD